MACRSSQLSCTSARAMASGQKSSCEASEALPAPAVSWRDSTASLLDAMMMMLCQNNCTCDPRELLLLHPRQQQMCCSHHPFPHNRGCKGVIFCNCSNQICDCNKARQVGEFAVAVQVDALMLPLVTYHW